MDFAASRGGANRERAKSIARSDAKSMLRQIDRRLTEAKRLENSASPVDRRLAELAKDEADDLLRQADAALAAANRL